MGALIFIWSVSIAYVIIACLIYIIESLEQPASNEALIAVMEKGECHYDKVRLQSAKGHVITTKDLTRINKQCPEGDVSRDVLTEQAQVIEAYRSSQSKLGHTGVYEGERK